MAEAFSATGEQGPLSPNHRIRDLIAEITPGRGTWRYADDSGTAHNVVVDNRTAEPDPEEPGLVGFVNDADLSGKEPATLYYLERVPDAATPEQELKLRVEPFDTRPLFSGSLGLGWRALIALALVGKAEAARRRGEDIATPGQTQYLITLLAGVRDRGTPLY